MLRTNASHAFVSSSFASRFTRPLWSGVFVSKWWGQEPVRMCNESGRIQNGG